MNPQNLEMDKNLIIRSNREAIRTARNTETSGMSISYVNR